MSLNIDDFLTVLSSISTSILEVYSNNSIDTHTKKDNSPVTIADIISHTRLTEYLSAYHYPVISEESQASQNINSGTFWLIDPLDGTVDFIQKTGDYSIMIALIEKAIPVLGIVHHPVSNSTYFALKGKGSYKYHKNRKMPLQTTNTANLSEALLVMSRNHRSNKENKIASILGVKDSIYMGSVGLKVAALVDQEADIYISLSDRMYAWDVCAPSIILEEAGGIFTDLNGQKIQCNPKQLGHKHGIIATNRHLYKNVKELIIPN